MKLSDYVINYLEERGIKHVFGYQGTMIAHFVESIRSSQTITNHSCYNEQGAAFAAVGLAKTTNEVAVAYSTSGPGAANLLSGVADAYYDSAPTIFFTGQLNTYEYTGLKNIRQQGFQEMDVVSTFKPITKYCTQITDKNDIKKVLDKAFFMAMEGRKGPVVIDLPMNIQREEIEPETLEGYIAPAQEDAVDYSQVASEILERMSQANRPVFLLGNGIAKGSQLHSDVLEVARRLRIPIVTSLPARHLLPYDDEFNFGHIGAAYGHRYANMIVDQKADLIISIACSMCKRQTGTKCENFAQSADIIRIDIDESELGRKVHGSETSYNANAELVLAELLKLVASKESISMWGEWLDDAKAIRSKLQNFDEGLAERMPNKIIELISDYAKEDEIVTADVGQHQVWVAQSFRFKEKQNVLFSGGHGAMGFSLPAGIGAAIGTKRHAMVLVGDGSFQMNIQELQWVYREQIPMTIIVLNNASLGLIQQQQDDMFSGTYAASTSESGYTVPDFAAVASAYKIDSYVAESPESLKEILDSLDTSKPALIDLRLDVKSRAFPKTNFGEAMYNQRPYMPAELLNELLEM